MAEHDRTTALSPRRTYLALAGIPAILTLMSTYIGFVNDIRWALAFGGLSAIGQFWVDIHRFHESRNRATPIVTRGEDMKPKATPFPVYRYDHPATQEEYDPDPAQPLDRWWQREDSANARTTRRIIEDLHQGRPSAIIDPFCGAGSSGVVAREWGLPFAGFDIDPFLACITVAKARCTTEHLRMLEQVSVSQDEYDTAALMKNRAEMSADAMSASCLGVLLSKIDSDAGRAAVIADLASAPGPAPSNTISCGDAGSDEVWRDLSGWPPGWVMYTSPPFPSSRRTGFSPPYSAIVLRMLRQLHALPPPGLVILEHEPGLDGEDALTVAHRINRENQVTIQRILRTQSFSDQGILSLIVCEVRR